MKSTVYILWALIFASFVYGPYFLMALLGVCPYWPHYEPYRIYSSAYSGDMKMSQSVVEWFVRYCFTPWLGGFVISFSVIAALLVSGVIAWRITYGPIKKRHDQTQDSH